MSVCKHTYMIVNHLVSARKKNTTYCIYSLLKYMWFTSVSSKCHSQYLGKKCMPQTKPDKQSSKSRTLKPVS